MLLTVLALVALLLLLLSRTQFEIREEIAINATVERVWTAVTDFENYHAWNSQLSYLGGTAGPKGKLHLRLAAEGASPYEFKPDVSHWVPNERFAWIARTGFARVFDGEHFFEMQALGPYQTLLINREEYRGILSLIFQQLPMMKTAPAGFEKMNKELKAYIEQESMG